MVAGEVESSSQLVATFFFFFFGLTLPNYRNKSESAQPPLISTTSSAAGHRPSKGTVCVCMVFIQKRWTSPKPFLHFKSAKSPSRKSWLYIPLMLLLMAKNYTYIPSAIIIVMPLHLVCMLH